MFQNFSSFELNDISYSCFFCVYPETLISESRKYNQAPPIHQDRISRLPAEVAGLTKEEILQHLPADNIAQDTLLLLTLSPIRSDEFEKNGKKYSVLLCQDLRTFVEEVKQKQDRIVIAERIDALPNTPPLQSGDYEFTKQDISFQIYNLVPKTDPFRFVYVVISNQ